MVHCAHPSQISRLPLFVFCSLAASLIEIVYILLLFVTF